MLKVELIKKKTQKQDKLIDNVASSQMKAIETSWSVRHRKIY